MFFNVFDFTSLTNTHESVHTVAQCGPVDPGLQRTRVLNSRREAPAVMTSLVHEPAARGRRSAARLIRRAGRAGANGELLQCFAVVIEFGPLNSDHCAVCI